jgi:hypothetical protein
VNLVEVSLDGRAFEPGETLTGTARWRLTVRPESVAVRLCWRTSGRGTTDLRIVDEILWVGPPAREDRQFKFRLPREPFSFSGKLISLTWTVEVVLDPSDESAHEDFVVAPRGREIVLTEVKAQK